MNPNDYQKLALVTDPDREDMGVTARVIKARLTVDDGRLLHAVMGLVTETGELMDALKRKLIYGKGIDRVNVMEECGDLLWYIALALDACDYTIEEAMERNITKLKKRYPDGYSDTNALNRDLEAERAALEGNGCVHLWEYVGIGRHGSDKGDLFYKCTKCGQRETR